MIKISSDTAMVITCDRCGTLGVIDGGPEDRWPAVLDVGTERFCDLARHGLLCGKSPAELQRLTDALRAVKEGVGVAPRDEDREGLRAAARAAGIPIPGEGL